MTIIPATPTPAIEAEPNLPTHIMSMVGPSMLRLPPTIICQPNETRLPIILPFVQSLSNFPSPPRPLPPLAKPTESSIVINQSFLYLHQKSAELRLLSSPKGQAKKRGYTCLRFHRPALKYVA